MIKLSNILIDNQYLIIENTAVGLLKERLLSLGFVKGSSISLIKEGKKKNMSIYLIKGMMIALRKDEADFIWVK